MDWHIPTGGICTCCDKPIAPRRPSRAAQAMADRSTVIELKTKCRRYQGIIAEGVKKLKTVLGYLESTREKNTALKERVIELEKMIEEYHKTQDEDYSASTWEYLHIMSYKKDLYAPTIDLNNSVATHDEQASC